MKWDSVPADIQRFAPSIPGSQDSANNIMRQAKPSTVSPMLLVATWLAFASILIDAASAVEVIDAGNTALPIPNPRTGQLTGMDSTTANNLPIPSQDCFILAARSFTIPFTVDQSGSRPVEVRLYVSRGPSDPWQMLSHKRPDVPQPQFEFAADADGEYWFATRTIDADGNAHPSTEIQPQLKVFVDTTKPIVDLILDASADGRIDASLSIVDSTPIQNVLARYVTDTAKEWQTINGDSLLANGALGFIPAQLWERLSMHVVVTDKAGNQSAVTRQVQRPRIAELPLNRYGSSQTLPHRTGDSERMSASTFADPVIQLDRHRDRALNQPSEFQTTQYQTDLKVAPSTPGGYAPNKIVSPFGGYRGGVSTTTQPATPFFRPAANPVENQVPPPPVPNPATNQAPSTGNFNFDSLFGRLPQPSAVAAPTVQTPSQTEFADGPQLQLPAPAEASTQAAGLDLPGLELPGLGLTGPQQTDPSAKPEVIPTPDAQRDSTGRATAAEPQPPTRPQPRTATEAMRPLAEKSLVPERELLPTPTPERRRVARPAPAEPPRAPVRHSDSERFSLDYELQAVGNLGVDAIELYGSVDDGKTWDLWGTDPDRVSPFDIETKEEGVFSFRIVVVGRNGLASPRPQPGETPDIVVVVDKVKPKVRITAAQYGEGNRIGALVIRYECIDPNLEPRPISLSFSDSTNGPWTTIAAGLRNDGEYVWPADPKLPRQIYLRIDAKDGAGNVGTYILDKPIDVQGLAPRARIRGFQSLSGKEAFPVDEQTAERPNATFK